MYMGYEDIQEAGKAEKIETVEKRRLHKIILEEIERRIPRALASSSARAEVELLVRLFCEAELSEADRKQVATRLKEFSKQISGKTTRPEIECLLSGVANIVVGN